jgi:hypothetical protein
MKSFAIWLKEDLGHSLIPQYIPRLFTGLIGNELRTDAGRSSRDRIGETERRYDIKTPIMELPVPRPNRQTGLGNLGLKAVGRDTFKESPKDGQKQPQQTRRFSNRRAAD